MVTTVAQIDPVCGMTVDPEHAAGSFEYQGKTYYFCSTHCLHKFRENPEAFLNKPAVQPVGITRQPPAKPKPDQKYTCPMHPEIIRDSPGSCPICGMALEPLTVSLEQEENHELKDMTRRLWIAVLAAIPVFMLGMSDLYSGQPHYSTTGVARTSCTHCSVRINTSCCSGWPFFVHAWQSIVNSSLNMFTLIGLGVGVGYVFSLVAVIAPGVFPASFRDAHGNVPVYFEAAAVIVALVLLGQVLELRARSQT